MKYHRFWRRLSLGLCLLLGAGAARLAYAEGGEAVGIDEIQQLFQNPPDDARMMVRWWWFGPAVTEAEIARELHAMKAAGIGGVEIQPVYPLVLDDPSTGLENLPYLSEKHLAALHHASEVASELGLRVDLTLGSGWPFGGPGVPITQAAGRLRVERIKFDAVQSQTTIPRIEEGEKLLAAFVSPSQGGALDPAATRELTEIKDGAVQIPAEFNAGGETLFFISSRTKQKVKRPSVGAEGYVLNHYDREAVEAYLKNVCDRLIEPFGDHPPYAVFCDSLECYLSDWTPDLLEEFQKRRGYDLKPYLPALVADFGPHTGDIRHDWGQTLTELFNERFAQPMREWAARHHTRFRMQAYGIPPANLSTNRFSDLPEGETFQWKRLSPARWATSAGHIYDRPVISSETWTWVHSPAFRATPLDLKAEADLHFLQGINQLIGHGWPYSAPQAESPGWRFYAAGALDDKNPWWIVMPDVTRYLQRVSALLRQGRPANDIAIYLPNDDAWAQFHNKQVHMIEILRERIGDEVVASVLQAGEDFDFFDDDALRETGAVEDGLLALGPSKYQAVILPNVDRMPLATLQKLADFAGRGGIVIATRRLPDHLPGFTATDAQTEELRTVVRNLFQTPGAPGYVIANEKADLAPKLRYLLRQDVNFTEGKPDLGFVHRHTGDAEIYFIANTAPTRHAVRTSFRGAAGAAEFWDPYTGAISPAGATVNDSRGATIALDLAAYESRVVVFAHRQLSTDAPAEGEPTEAPVLDLSGGWRVAFDQGPATPMETLRSWTDDESTRHYSGLAIYEKEFEISKDALDPSATLQLDFGAAKPIPITALANGMRAWLDAPVREAAVVYLNDQRVGAIWRPPYRLDVTAYVQPGANRLRIVVGNTAINALSGHPLPDYHQLNQKYGERFKPQDMDNLQPLPSGLIGPVQLLRVKLVPQLQVE